MVSLVIVPIVLTIVVVVVLVLVMIVVIPAILVIRVVGVRIVVTAASLLVKHNASPEAEQEAWLQRTTHHSTRRLVDVHPGCCAHCCHNIAGHLDSTSLCCLGGRDRIRRRSRGGLGRPGLDLGGIPTYWALSLN